MSTVTLREKFAADPKFKNGNPVILSAIMLVAYEYQGRSFRLDDPAVQCRLATLRQMTDEQFDKEHRRVLEEFAAA